jgi:pimeloyl-ACP methyl ester carboxylesterase
MGDGLLLLHAFPLDASMWAPQDSAFGDVTVVAPDLPGFGRSRPAPDVLTMDDAAQAGVRALDEAGIQRAVVLGLSMGGYAALAFWDRHPDRVAGLVLANTRAGADDDAGRERRRALAERLRTEGSGFLVESPPPLLSADAPVELWERVRSIIGGQDAGAIAAASLGMAERADYTSRLGEIAVPTLVVTSSADTLIPPDLTTPMAEAIPGATLEVIDGVGHLSNLEAPEAFNAAVEAHLGRALRR